MVLPILGSTITCRLGAYNDSLCLPGRFVLVSLPQGHIAAASPTFGHALPSVFPEPSKFNPDRFMQDPNIKVGICSICAIQESAPTHMSHTCAQSANQIVTWLHVSTKLHGVCLLCHDPLALLVMLCCYLIPCMFTSKRLCRLRPYPHPHMMSAGSACADDEAGHKACNRC